MTLTPDHIVTDANGSGKIPIPPRKGVDVVLNAEEIEYLKSFEAGSIIYCDSVREKTHDGGFTESAEARLLFLNLPPVGMEACKNVGLNESYDCLKSLLYHMTRHLGSGINKEPKPGKKIMHYYTAEAGSGYSLKGKAAKDVATILAKNGIDFEGKALLASNERGNATISLP